MANQELEQFIEEVRYTADLERIRLENRHVRSENGMSYPFVVLSANPLDSPAPTRVKLSEPAMQAIRVETVLRVCEILSGNGNARDLIGLIREGQ